MRYFFYKEFNHVFSRHTSIPSANFRLFKRHSSNVSESDLIRKITSKPFKVLGIETSCDDTGVSIVSSNGNILGSSLASQYHIHDEYGGIFPRLAVREHEKNIDVVLNEAVERSQIHDFSELSAIAVTVGPGMAACLRIGLDKARELCNQYQLPLFPVNHLEGHSLVVRMMNYLPESQHQVEFPYLLLLVSGGHSQLLYCKSIGDYEQLGGTLDDAMGECFDKVARAIGLSWSEGGQGLERLAAEGDPNSYNLPLPLKQFKNCDFSFSGLKAASARLVQILKQDHLLHEDDSLVEKLRPVAANVAASFQRVVLKHVVQRTERALQYCNDHNEQPIRTIVVAGGVARNQALRTQLQQMSLNRNANVCFPPMDLCVDNGTMIAWTAVEWLKHLSSEMANNNSSSSEKRLLVDSADILSIQPRSRWPIAKSTTVHAFGSNYRNPAAHLKQRAVI